MRTQDAGWWCRKGVWGWKDHPGGPGHWQPRLDALRRRRWRSFSWLTTRALLDSANDKVAKVIHDLVGARRQRWMATQLAAGVDPSLAIPAEGARACMILGDTGEADGSQFAVIDPMLAIHRHHGSDLMVILSDVIYPAGDINDYVNAFYEAYADYDKPIYALPGNHDWYDGLNGFMFHFCGSDPLGPTAYRGSSYRGSERVANWLWRRSARPDRTRLASHRRAQRPVQPTQPAPYWQLRLGPVCLVAIDTGISGTIDGEQAEWLIGVSRTAGKKVLLTGKPLWVNGAYRPCRIDWGPLSVHGDAYETVDDIVRDPRHDYVAAIGGDVHNYQRYRISLTERAEPCSGGCDGRRDLQYLVAGGSGAYMSDIHTIGRVGPHKPEPASEAPKRLRDRTQALYEGRSLPRWKDPPPPESVAPLDESRFRSYPMRADSLAYYARWYGPRMFRIAVAAVVALVVTATATLLIHDEPLGGAALAGSELERQALWHVVTGGLAFVVAVVLVLGLAFAASKTLFPSRYRMMGFALLAAGGLLGAVIAGAGLIGDDVWAWGWRVGLLCLGTLLAPALLALVAYYWGSGDSRAQHDLGALAVLAFVGATWLAQATDIPDVAILALAIAFVAVALGATARLRPPVGVYLRTHLRRAGPILAVLGYAAVAGLLGWRYWGTSAVRVVAVSAGGLVLVTSAVVVPVLVVTGRLGLPAMWRGRLDPNQALAWVRRHGMREGRLIGDAADVVPTRRTRSICGALTRMPLVSQLGNADTPPMFKSFLRVALSEDDSALEVTCYGVTGWCEHECPGSVPVEDRFSIPLTGDPCGCRGAGSAATATTPPRRTGLLRRAWGAVSGRASGCTSSTSRRTRG